EFQRSLHVGYSRDKENAGRDFCGCIDRDEICFRPRTSSRDGFGFLTVEITHAGRERVHGLVKPFGKYAAKDTEQFRRGIDFDLWIDLQQVVQAARMVSMPV